MASYLADIVKKNDITLSPIAVGAFCPANDLLLPAGSGNHVKLTAIKVEEREIPAVRRPERTVRIFRSGKRIRLQRTQRTNPYLRIPGCIESTKRQKASVG